jgi:hypothetical protein
MPYILVTLWDRYDKEKFVWIPLGKEPKSRRKVTPVKQTKWQRFYENCLRLIGRG